MAHVSDVSASLRRMKRIDEVIAAQKIFLLSTSIERQMQSERNLITLIAMRLKLGIKVDATQARNAQARERHMLTLMY